jgi:hypothetical protein
MGEVYAAYDPSLDRRVALKMMHGAAAAQDDHAAARMLREAQAIAKLSHPNVVVVYEVGTFDGAVFIAMEFVDGRTLSEWLADGERSWREVLDVFLQAARGLSAAHRAGFVHRDFKPQNVMVTNDGHVRVMDFGLARRIDPHAELGASGEFLLRSPTHVEGTLTGPGEQLGTPLYMAPEQFASARIDARTDQFSFCVALFWALFGVHPFGAGQGEGTFPKLVRPPAWLRHVIVRGLSVAPDARWPSMDALIAALAPRPSARKRAFVASAIAAALSVLSLAGLRVLDREQAVCLAGPDRMVGIWELPGRVERPTPRRDAVHAAILKSGLRDPSSLWERVAASLDRHSTKWLATYRDACEATLVRHEQSEETLDLAMACLNDDLDSTNALTQILSAGDPLVLGRALEATGALLAVDRCGDARQLHSATRPPKDPLLRAEVERLRRRLKEAEALHDIGRCEAALPIADEVLARAVAIQYCPLRAEALAVKADNLGLIDHARSIPAFEEAIVVGEACGHDMVVAHAATELTIDYAYVDSRLAERSAALARAALERIGGDSRLEGWLANNLGALHLWQGNVQEATVDTEQAVATKIRVLGADHPDVGRSLSNLSTLLRLRGRLAEALEANDAGSRAFGTWDSESLIWNMHLAHRSAILCGLGRLDEAQAIADLLFRARDKWARGDEGDLLGELSCIKVARGSTADAIAHLEDTLSAQRRAQTSRWQLAETQFQLALALAKQTGRSSRSEKLAQAALTIYSGLPDFSWQRQEVQGWLAEHAVVRPAAAPGPKLFDSAVKPSRQPEK